MTGEATPRILPWSPDVERSVLGSMLIDERALETGLDMLEPGIFYNTSHAAIFASVARIAARGELVDPLTVSEDLRALRAIEKVGGEAYLSELVGSNTSPRIEGRCRALVAKSALREIIRTCGAVANSAFDDDADPEELVDSAEKELYRIASLSTRSDTIHRVVDVMRTSMDTIRRSVAAGKPTGVTTGFRDLDAQTTGLHGGDLVIVAGRPSMGKSAFGLSVAVAAARAGDGSAAFFSLEMTRAQLAERLLTSESGVEMHRLRSGRICQAELMTLDSQVTKWDSVNVWLDDSPGIKLREIRSRVRKLKSRTPVSIVVIDYLQLMGVDGKPGRSRQEDVSLISSGLKGLAKELGIPVVALSQLSRAVEARGKQKRPQLSDLRESGAIEQDADTVLMLYRDEYYFPRTTKSPGVAEVIIGKQRNGPVGTIRLAFDKRYIKFSDLDKEHADAGVHQESVNFYGGEEAGDDEW